MGNRRHTDRRYRLPDVMRRSIGVCSVCGKQMYLSKKDAKADARRLYPGDLMRVYQCGEMWHITSQSTRQMTRWRAWNAGSGPYAAQAPGSDMPGDIDDQTEEQA